MLICLNEHENICATIYTKPLKTGYKRDLVWKLFRWEIIRFLFTCIYIGILIYAQKTNIQQYIDI